MEKNLIAKCVDIVKQGDIEDRYPFEMSVYLIYDNGTCENDEMYQMSCDDMEFVTGMKSDELNKLSDIEIARIIAENSHPYGIGDEQDVYDYYSSGLRYYSNTIAIKLQEDI